METATQHPNTTALVETLDLAFRVADTEASRAAIEAARVRARESRQDYTDAEVRGVLEVLGLIRSDSKVCRLIVDGVTEKTFIISNQFHAVNHVRKHHPELHSVEYRFAGRHEVHASRLAVEFKGCDDVEEFVAVCGFCDRELPKCAACATGEATTSNPHTCSHECPAQSRANARRS